MPARGTWHECLSAYRVCRQGDMARVSLSLKCTGKGTWHECLSSYRVCRHRERACSDDKPSAGCQPASLQLSRSEGATSYHSHSLLLVTPLSTLRALVLCRSVSIKTLLKRGLLSLFFTEQRRCDNSSTELNRFSTSPDMNK